jgi:hypothetical protein
MNLWTLTLPPQGNGALPILTRGNSSPVTSTQVNGADVSQLRFKNYGADATSQDYIDVIQDFQWTKSPKISRLDTPQVYMYEKRILTNNSIANAAYSVFATLDGGATIAKTITELGGIATGGLTDKALQAFKESEIGKKAYETLNNGIDKIKSSLGTFNNPALEPYTGLYITEDTGFKYIFPYFDNKYFDATASYSTESNGGMLESVIGIVTDVAEASKNLAGLLKPGTYIEKSQQFRFGESGRSINIKIPLLNTGTYSDISNNWQLLFALIYQNRPGRYDKNIIDLPVIYSIDIPGTVSLPYAYISSLSIEFIGNRRLMGIDIPDVIGKDGKIINRITTIIPDAYQLSMTITGLNEETRNFLFAGLNRRTPVTVTTQKQ